MAQPQQQQSDRLKFQKKKIKDQSQEIKEQQDKINEWIKQQKIQGTIQW